jgi:murein DD-endopeptidase MepM/ murein hydrolase activator NlpD
MADPTRLASWGDSNLKWFACLWSVWVTFGLAACKPSAPLPTPTLPAPKAIFSTATAVPTRTPTASATASATATNSPTATFSPTPFPSKVPGATFTAVPVFGSPAQPLAAHGWFARPIAPGVGVDYPASNYRYGETQAGYLEPHHGVEFANPLGIPVLAVGDGLVVFAGSDASVPDPLGPTLDFYGQAVVIQHTQAYQGSPVFSLYGHLSQVTVQVGQVVQTGTQLGNVGGTGIANGGAHLHFEIRVGYNDYQSSRNPELWLRPFPNWGGLAGRVTGANGELIAEANVSIRSLDLPNYPNFVVRYLMTYAAETVNPDEVLGENFATVDLPPGEYEVSVSTELSSAKTTVRIEPNQLAWVAFGDIKPPFTRTPPPLFSPTPNETATSTPDLSLVPTSEVSPP